MKLDYETEFAVNREPEFAEAPAARPMPAIWPHAVNLVLGAWLLAAPATLGFQSAALVWSDMLCGAAVLLFAGLSLSSKNLWAHWIVSGIGLWLMFAPLVFWAPTAAAYANDTLVGTLLITFALIIPGVRGIAIRPGPDIPPGWNYNPSAWMQRTPIIALAFVGFFISRYLAAYQLGHIPTVWDPFFPGGTKAVLESKVSRAWPISDAGLGAISYILEALTGFLGGTRRWRTMPWLVIVFGILVVPLGVTSIVLIILQPLAVEAWCTLCLITAAAMLIMIGPAADEVIATCQFLMQSRREGRPFWRTFFLGGTVERDTEPAQPVRRVGVGISLVQATGLHNIPWNLGLSALLGGWLMFAPSVFRTTGAAADSDHLVGALIVTFAVIAWAEVSRATRWLNISLGAWLIAAPWLLSGGNTAALWNNVVVGAAVIVLTFRRGPVTERFGAWDRLVV